MALSAPLWLLWLVPWTALAVWLLQGWPESRPVPFVRLWRESAVVRSSRARFHRPPVAVVLGLGAMLLAIVAASRPRWMLSFPKVPSEGDGQHLPDDRANTSGRNSWPEIVAGDGLAPEVQRMLQTYTKLRPPDKKSIHIRVVAGPLPADQPGVVVPALTHSHSATSIKLADHPIVANIDWRGLSGQIELSAPPGPGWQQVVGISDRPLVAVREQPARQVWIGFWSQSWTQTSDFVVFWTNVLDWAGQCEPAIGAPPAKEAGIALAAVVSPTSAVEIAPALLVVAVLMIFASIVFAHLQNLRGRVGFPP